MNNPLSPRDRESRDTGIGMDESTKSPDKDRIENLDTG